MGEKLRQFFGVPSLSVFFTFLIGCVSVPVIIAAAMEGKSLVLKALVFVVLLLAIRGVSALVRYFQKR